MVQVAFCYSLCWLWRCQPEKNRRWGALKNQVTSLRCREPTAVSAICQFAVTEVSRLNTVLYDILVVAVYVRHSPSVLHVIAHSQHLHFHPLSHMVTWWEKNQMREDTHTNGHKNTHTRTHTQKCTVLYKHTQMCMLKQPFMSCT